MLSRIFLVTIAAVTLVGLVPQSAAPQGRNIKWTHLSSKTRDLPAPNGGNQQTASLVLDIDKDGVNDFVITERTQAPAAVWYRRTQSGWTRHILEAGALRIEAGGAFADIDSDGDLDVVFAGDAQSNEVWWWENPLYGDRELGTEKSSERSMTTSQSPGGGAPSRAPAPTNTTIKFSATLTAMERRNWFSGTRERRG